MDRNELIDRLLVARALASRGAGKSFQRYLEALVINCRPEPRAFRDVARPWQWERYERVRYALEDVTGITPGYSGPRRFWETMPRGHDKTTGLGRVANWALGFSKRPLTILAAAADRDQAALLTDAMRLEADLNPWLKERLSFQRDRVTGPGGALKIMTSDAPSAMGERADLIICDEVTHWQNRTLWDALYSGINKMQGAICWVITNAGLLGSWQHDLLLTLKGMEGWVVYEAPGSLNTWMDSRAIAEDRKLLLPSEARRLLDNVWIDPAEASGYLTRAEVQACEELGRSLGLQYAPAPRNGLEYWAGIDYGPKRDRTALSILHQEEDGRVLIDRLDVWQGSPEAPIPVSQIREWVDAQGERYPNLSLVVDTYQLDEFVQDYSRWYAIERFEARGGKANYQLAETLRTAIVNGQLAWYPGAGSLPVDGAFETLTDELASLVVRRMSYGYRIDHETTKHDDRAVAVGMPLVAILGRDRASKFVKPKTVQRPATLDEDSPTLLRRRDRAEGRGLFGMG